MSLKLYTIIYVFLNANKFLNTFCACYYLSYYRMITLTPLYLTTVSKTIIKYYSCSFVTVECS